MTGEPPRAPDGARRIDVLVVTYRSERHVDRLLPSLQEAAPRSALRLRVLDNASGDAAADRLEAAGAAVVRSPRNLGFAAGVNALSRDVDAPWMLLLNPDAAPRPGAVDRLLDAALARPDRDVFGGRTVYPDGAPNAGNAWAHVTPASAVLRAVGAAAAWPGSRLNPEAMPAWDRLSDREVDVATGCALLVRTDAWRTFGGFDETYWLYGEEAELQLRMQRAGRPSSWIASDAVFVHDNGARVSEDEAPADQARRAAAVLRGRATLMRRAWPRRWRPLAGPILGLEAARHGLQSLVPSAGRARHRALWTGRRGWIDGYAPRRGPGSAPPEGDRSP